MSKPKKIWYTPREAMQFFPHLRKKEPEAIREWIRKGLLKAVVGTPAREKHGRRYIIHINEIRKIIKPSSKFYKRG